HTIDVAPREEGQAGRFGARFPRRPVGRTPPARRRPDPPASLDPAMTELGITSSPRLERLPCGILRYFVQVGGLMMDEYSESTEAVRSWEPPLPGGRRVALRFDSTIRHGRESFLAPRWDQWKPPPRSGDLVQCG